MEFTTFFSGLAAKTILKKGKDYFIKNFTNENKFQEELTGVINETLEVFQKSNPPTKGEKIAFYESQEVIENLLQFTFFSDYDFSKLDVFIKTNPNFILAKEEDITSFIELLKDNLEKHSSLKDLEINYNFKKNIARILEKSNQIDSALQNTLREIDDSLNGEYNRQLTEIKENIKTFKAKSALQRLESLKDSIIQKNRMTDPLMGSISYLQGLCLEDIESGVENKAETYIRAYNYNNTNPEYKIKAALSYLNLKDSQKSKLLAEEILQKDEYNVIAFFITFILSEECLEAKLKTTPVRILKSKTFIPMLFNWLLATIQVEEAKHIEKYYLPKEILEPEIPEKINYQKKDYWFLIALINLNNFYLGSQNTSMIIEKQAVSKNHKLQYLHKLLSLINDTFAETEINSKFYLHLFYKSYLDFAFNEDNFSLKVLEERYRKITTPFSANLMALTQILITLNEYHKALAYIEEFDCSENKFEKKQKIIFKCIISKLLNDLPSAATSLLEYTIMTDDVDSLALANILTLSDNLFNSKEEIKAFKESVLSSAKFGSQEEQILFEAFFETNFLHEMSKKDLDDKIQLLKSSDSINKELKSFIGVILYNEKRVDETIQYLSSYINKEKADSDLFLYLNCLIEYKESDKIELLKLLKWWRNNAGLHFRFLSAEIYYRQYIEDWDEIELISSLGKFKFPDEDYFLVQQAIAINKLNDPDKLNKILPELTKSVYKHETDVITVFAILIRFHYFEEALELLYNSAKNKYNTLSRQAYFSNTLLIPDRLFQEYDIAEPGNYVKYQIDEKINFTKIPENNTSDNIEASLIGKKKGELLYIRENIGVSIIKVRVLRIMNKYLALLEEILSEADNPYSGLKIKKIESPNDEIEAFEKTLIENFGVEEEMRNQMLTENIGKYHQGVLSFTEIVAANFNGSFVAAYSYLISNVSDGFLTIPSILCDKKNLQSSKFIIDASTIVLFFEMSEHFKIIGTSKFYLSPFLKEQIKEELINAELSKPESFSLNITTDKVYPVFFPEDFQQKKTDFLKKLLTWIDENTLPLIIEKRVSFNSYMDSDKGNFKNSVRALIDNILGIEEGLVLITSDFFYYKQLPQFRPNIISPQVYFESASVLKKEETSLYLLNKRYIGIDVNEQILFEEWMKSQAMKENKYHICLLNISHYYNPSHINIGVAIRFLKNVYLTNWLKQEDKNTVAHRVFLNLLRGVSQDVKFIRLVRLVINNEFSLLGSMLEMIIHEYYKAVDILNCS